ncbi:MAG TPA: YhjD/YihY/BrkB family envelope integrity protein, partial [Caldimonas sp.]|nr:YhjD/YihY/BrkB family envelope integrity protein [Caldimonas sp.]
SLGIAALFHFVPNTHVRWRHALAGGAFVAIGFALSKRLLAIYFGTVPTYSMIYGAFAAVPIFLIWIYLSWIIVLLGAILAAYAPVARMQVRRWPPAPGSRFHLALMMLRALVAERAAGRPGLTDIELARRLGTDPLQVQPLLDALVEIDWVGRLDEAGNARYVLVCDPQRVVAEALVGKLLLDPSPDLAGFWRQAHFAEMRLDEILRE